MRQSAFFFILTTAALLTFGCGKGPELAKVGGTSITESELEVLGEINPRLKPRLVTPAGKQKILENYVEQTLLYREATRRGLQRSKETKQKLDLYKKVIIAQAVLDDELNKRVKDYYENHKDEFERVNVSHLLIRTVADEGTQEKSKQAKKPTPKRSEAEAQKLVDRVKERLAKGEDFAKVAAETSEDARTKQNQGNLGYITLRDKRLERWGWLPLAEKAFGLKEGDVMGPIKTKDGFHLIKVVEGKKLQPLEEADPGIRFRLQQEVRNSLLEELKKKYKVVYTQPAATPAPSGTVPPAPPGAAAPGEVPVAPPPVNIAPPAGTPETPPKP